MNILTVVSNLNKGGTQRAGQNFAMGYKKLGHDSRILSLYGLGYRYKEIKDTLEVFSGIESKTLSNISNWNPDIIHIHSHGPKAKDVNKLIAFLESENVFPKILEQNVFSNPTHWENSLHASFQLSKWCQWLYQKRGGNASKSTILPYAVITNNFYPASRASTLEFRKTYNIPEDAFVIGRIGQAITTKWCKSIVEVFEGVSNSNPNIYLLLIGCPQKIFDLFKKSKFQKNIINIDVLYGDDNLSKAYSSMDVFYHAAEQGESFGHVLAESILCGTPVVTLSTPWGDNSQIEVVHNNKGGYVVHRPKSAINVINNLISNNIEYNPQTAIDHIKENYDFINVCKKAVELSQTNAYTSEIGITELKHILHQSYDKARPLDALLLKLNLKQLIRLTSGYNTISTFIYKVFTKVSKRMRITA